ncbi:uncharacterized protein LOC135613156 [Musa acuminata AAA Group]|uniref:uncharacterized protein LOC135613156 n=1 Tax=Musa acuminata AAA Group TaxID=214697 RepID=UPI0031D75DA9
MVVLAGSWVRASGHGRCLLLPPSPTPSIFLLPTFSLAFRADRFVLVRWVPYVSRGMAEATRSSDSKEEPNHSVVSVHDRDGSSPQPRTNSSGSPSSPEVDPESGLSVNPDRKAARECRICYLALENSASESGPPIVLGCSCKHDLAVAHERCAQTWFEAKGNRICEICGSTAKNVVPSGDAASTEQMNEGDDPAMAPAQPSSSSSSSSSSSDRSLWRRQCFLNFLLTFLVFLCAFSWLYHYNLPY